MVPAVQQKHADISKVQATVQAIKVSNEQDSADSDSDSEGETLNLDC